MSTESIHLSPSDFNNLLWCATRYCIGRHSTVSTYAQDFWHIIRGHREFLSKDRLEFFARDIRAEVSDRIHHYGNISVKHAHNSCIKHDALTLLAAHTKQHRFDQRPHETFYEVDCLTGEVHASPWDDRARQSYNIPFQVDNEYDLPCWILLANCIDRQYEVKLKVNGKERTELCVKHPVDDKFITVDNWNASLCNELIIDVKPLFEI